MMHVIYNYTHMISSTEGARKKIIQKPTYVMCENSFQSKSNMTVHTKIR